MRRHGQKVRFLVLPFEKHVLVEQFQKNFLDYVFVSQVLNLRVVLRSHLINVWGM